MAAILEGTKVSLRGYPLRKTIDRRDSSKKTFVMLKNKNRKGRSEKKVIRV